MSERGSKIALKGSMARHLEELRGLVGREVQISDLMSLQETEAVRARLNSIKRSPKWSTEICFSERLDRRFRQFIENLKDSNGAPVYVWTPLSNVCGLLRPVPLSSVSFGFGFDINDDGLISIVASDCIDRMVLDFYVDGQQREMLSLDVSGEHWGTVRY